jgi:KipI family sensor histidine kinase inhibitor
MNIFPASDRSILVSFEPEISLAVHQRVARLQYALADASIPAIRNLHPGYCSLLIEFDSLTLPHAQLQSRVRELWLDSEHQMVPEGRLFEIPVRYGGEFGPDLDDVAALHGLRPERVIGLHSEPEYFVFFLGFSPGFAYLGGLPRGLATPRLAVPRTRVPAGSVGIGGNQTGIYPLASPGGWRIIGRTDLRLFDTSAEPPALLRAGDRLRFVPVPT